MLASVDSQGRAWYSEYNLCNLSVGLKEERDRLGTFTHGVL